MRVLLAVLLVICGAGAYAFGDGVSLRPLSPEEVQRAGAGPFAECVLTQTCEQWAQSQPQQPMCVAACTPADEGDYCCMCPNKEPHCSKSDCQWAWDWWCDNEAHCGCQELALGRCVDSRCMDPVIRPEYTCGFIMFTCARP